MKEKFENEMKLEFISKSANDAAIAAGEPHIESNTAADFYLRLLQSGSEDGIVNHIKDNCTSTDTHCDDKRIKLKFY